MKIEQLKRLKERQALMVPSAISNTDESKSAYLNPDNVLDDPSSISNVKTI